MSKDMYNNSAFLGKSLYNLQPAGRINESALNGFLNDFIKNGVITDTSAGTGAGDQIFGVITADILNTNIVNSAQEFSLGDNGLLRIIPTDQQRINDAFTYGTMLTTNLYSRQAGLASGYTSIKLSVPYVYNEPDRILVASNKEAPDNFLEVSNSKFRVTGPFTFIKSTKTSFKGPIITLGYYDREESTFEGATTLNLKTYDKGIVMERVESNTMSLDNIKFSYMGYSQNLDRFVMYKDGKYTGTDKYYYPKMDGTPSDQEAVLTEYNIGRNPDTIGQVAGNSALEVDTIYTNTINSSDHTTSKSITINSYDRMTIGVSRAVGDTDPNRNFDLLLDVAGKIIMKSGGGDGTVQTSATDYRIESETGTFINAYNPDNLTYMGVPVFIGYESTVNVDNYLKTTYISTGVDTRNADTMVEFGGDFIASNGTTASSKLLIDGSITGNNNNDIHGIYSGPTINVPNTNSINYVSNLTLQPSVLNLGTGSNVNTSSTLHVVGATSNATNNYSILSSQGNVRFLGSDITNAHLDWSNDTLDLFNARLSVNSEVSNLPVLSFGVPESGTSFYTLKRTNVDGSNELFVDGNITRITLEDNTNYTIIGTIMASQGSDTCASYRVEYCLSIRNGIKIQKYFRLNVIVCDIDINDNEIFDLVVSYTGNQTNFVSGDCITVTGTNTNNTATNWFGLLEVTTLKKP